MSGSSVGNGGLVPPFTVAQWAEMEHQALIFKYLKAGLPVPPDLLGPIRTSFNLISSNFLRHHPTLGYTSYCGKKIDPEPGRCRRTDGKKWRCSKDAHPDSKYYSVIGSSSHSGSLQNMPLHSMVNSGGLSFGSNVSQLKMEPIPYGIGNSGNRGRNGAEEHNFMSEPSGSVRCLGMDSTVDSPWHLMVPRVSLKSEPKNCSLLLNNSSQLETLQHTEPLTVDAAITKQQQHQYVGGQFGFPGSLKQEQNSLQPFFDEWPKSRDLGFHLSDHRSTNTLTATQLSMSNAMAPSKFFARSADSPTDAYT
ncbi:growth-regulating factor 4-like [Prunus yedoensis var. nudiflora]|uniref:Growth-regulating factor n=1 Tax=Prunus yedoensis var. nudiflora TaxID=2094558 RepID=A0A314XU26_PRUYE|nr:growth-regulating factor 4-like [Prunus yedoensis var. nudiflora]